MYMSSLVHMYVTGITFIRYAQSWNILVHQVRSKLKDIGSQNVAEQVSQMFTILVINK
jgi:hypothetical protein